MFSPFSPGAGPALRSDGHGRPGPGGPLGRMEDHRHRTLPDPLPQRVASLPSLNHPPPLEQVGLHRPLDGQMKDPTVGTVTVSFRP